MPPDLSPLAGFRPPKARTASERFFAVAGAVVERELQQARAAAEQRHPAAAPGAVGDLPVPELAQYADDPIRFAVEELGIARATIYAELEQVCLSVRDNRITDVQAGHGVGKTFIAGRVIVPWWVYCLGGSFVSTAPTGRQVRRLLWKEINQAHAVLKRRYGAAVGRCDVVQLKVTPSIYGYGFTAPHWDPDAFQGEHMPQLLVIGDEANGLAPGILSGMGSLAVGAQNRQLRIGNPTAANTAFFRSTRQPSESGIHRTIKIPVWSHPNVKTKREVVPGAVTVQWIDQVRREHGEHSSYWTARVNAEFPIDEPESLVPRSAFDEAVHRYEEDPRRWKVKGRIGYGFGVDIGERSDRTAVAVVANRTLVQLSAREPIKDDRELARATAILRDFLDRAPRGSWMNIDAIGVGAGVASFLIDEEYPVNAVRVSETALTPDEYRLIRDELYGELRRGFMTHTLAIRPPASPAEEALIEALKDELSAIHWDRDIHGRFRAELKDKTKARLGRSPDLAEAVMLAFANFTPRDDDDTVYDYDEAEGFVL